MLLQHDAVLLQPQSLMEMERRSGHCCGTRSCRMVPIPAAPGTNEKGEWAAHKKHGAVIKSGGAKCFTSLLSSFIQIQGCSECAVCPAGGNAEPSTAAAPLSNPPVNSLTHSIAVCIKQGRPRFDPYAWTDAFLCVVCFLCFHHSVLKRVSIRDTNLSEGLLSLSFSLHRSVCAPCSLKWTRYSLCLHPV